MRCRRLAANTECLNERFLPPLIDELPFQNMSGDAERGIEWGEAALGLSPIDPMRFGPCPAIAFGQIQRGNDEAALEAARKCFQAKPNWSFAHMLLAATHARLGQLDAARAAARRVPELEPAYTISGMGAAGRFHPSIAEPLSDALRRAGLPA